VLKANVLGVYGTALTGLDTAVISNFFDDSDIGESFEICISSNSTFDAALCAAVGISDHTASAKLAVKIALSHVSKKYGSHQKQNLHHEHSACKGSFSHLTVFEVTGSSCIFTALCDVPSCV
jgi:hypothetical protein